MKTNRDSQCCNLDEFVRAMADESRQRILTLLEGGKMDVQTLTGHLGLSQSTVSYHLARLREVELVTVRRQGRQAYYRANPACVAECCREISKRFSPTSTDRA